MYNDLFNSCEIDYVELYVPMAKSLSYWHTTGLGFSIEAYKGVETGFPNVSSYLLVSGNVRLVLTSTYPTISGARLDVEISNFIYSHYAGVKRIVLKTGHVGEIFDQAIAAGAIPLKAPARMSDKSGYVEFASIRLYDDAEIMFLDRENYSGAFLPGFKATEGAVPKHSHFTYIDHIASELRVNEISYWSKYLERSIGTKIVQEVRPSEENKTGMIMNICQSGNKNLTMVLSEPADIVGKTKINDTIDNYGPGIHHLAFATNDIFDTIKCLQSANIELVKAPSSYYEPLRKTELARDVDIDELERLGILIDKEDDSFLFQKFIRPSGDRPFFLYEVVQRVNGYEGFALNNINALKRAEEKDLAKIG